MDLNPILNPSDATRAERTIRKLPEAALSQWALTGGLAIEFHLLARGAAPRIRPLHDIDFIADSFDDIPISLGKELLLRHVHPHDPPGKTLLQAVDPESEVRIDLFRAYGAEMERTVPVIIAGLQLRIVSFHDLVARHARLNWDLIEGHPIAPKYARDFLRMVALAAPAEIQPIWQEHRKPHMPKDFRETLHRIQTAIETRPDLQIPPTYSTDPNEVCARCENSEAFPLADATHILSILNYC